MTAEAWPGLEIFRVLGLTAMALMLLIGFSCLIAALFLFNHFYHEQRGRPMSGDKLLTEYSGLSIFGVLVFLRESLIALLSLVVHWRQNRSGRITFLVGGSLFACGMLFGWWVAAGSPS